MLNNGSMLIPIGAEPELGSWREPEDKSHLPLNGADYVVGASWDPTLLRDSWGPTLLIDSWGPTLLRDSWGQLQGQTWSQFCFRALRLLSAILQQQTEPGTGTNPKVQGFAVVLFGFQTPALQHNAATLEPLRKGLGSFAWFWVCLGVYCVWSIMERDRLFRGRLACPEFEVLGAGELSLLFLVLWKGPS